ncbi:4-hydroxythreonine-4-phosphate dehydrogenase PdxA [Rickettsiales bacterium LUAb2]
MRLLTTLLNYNHNHTTPIAVTSGNPESIAPSILIKTWLALRKHNNLSFFTINNNQYLTSIAKQFNLPLKTKIIKDPKEAPLIFKNYLPVVDIPLEEPVVLGKPNTNNVKFIINSLDIAISLALNKTINALVTLPIDKNIMQQGGFNFIGHTEYLAHKSNIPLPVMMLSSLTPKINVIPITTHTSLKNSIIELTPEKIISTVQTTYNSLIKLLNIKSPKFAILGLNPHAGENGLMGNEELTIINPAINHLKSLGIDITGPLPADTAFIPNILKQFDIIFGMYHDQVLAPFKALAFDNGVNCTLGLPFIRTSPDHGTAFNIANKNIASESSTISAILLANQLQHNQIHN